jgi:hypothetical protein
MTHPTPHPRAVSASISASTDSWKLAAAGSGIGTTEAKAILAVQRTRRARRWGCDPLVARAQGRAFRLTLLRQERARQAAAAQAKAVRATLLAAARVARALGFTVRASSFDGRVSSYYCRRGDGRQIRISDHAIPPTQARDCQAFAAGSFSGYQGYGGPELLIDRPRPKLWLRRAILLTAAGRSVP